MAEPRAHHSIRCPVIHRPPRRLQLSEAEASSLLAQLSAIDVALVNELFTATMAANAGDAAPVSSKLSPADGVTKVSDSTPETLTTWRHAGLTAIAHGQAAALILAGGQGTRLGFDKPKGLYDVRLPSHKSLFRLQAQRIIRVKELAAAAAGVPASSVSLPLYVMTSPMTDADTRDYFKEQAFFGLPHSDVMFFSQGTLPCLTFDGKIMLQDGHTVAEAPDGNGGIYRALHLSGVVADMQKRGVVGTHVFAVDNAVVRAADPVFLGYCMSKGADVGSKVCPKAGPHEKVGVLCRRDGAYTVVEYSEMDKATAELRDDVTGELTFNAGNICIHYYSTDFLATKCSPSALPKVYHVAKKAIPYAHSDTGATLTKAELAARHASTGGNSGIKLESFIFDVFPSSDAMAVLQITREAEFSPVKNAPCAPDDSPDTARALISTLHAGWLAAAGATVEDQQGALVEVSPLVSYGGEGLEAFRGQTVATPALILTSDEPLPFGALPVEGDVPRVLPGTAVMHSAVRGVDVPGQAEGAPLHVYRLTQQQMQQQQQAPPAINTAASSSAASGSGKRGREEGEEGLPAESPKASPKARTTE